MDVQIYMPPAIVVGRSIPSWGAMYLFILLVVVGIKGGSSMASGDIPNPGLIVDAAGKAVTSRVNILFEDVISVGEELSNSIVSIRESLVQAAQTMRVFFTMVTSFIISFSKMLQGLMGSALNMVTVIKGLLNSLFDTMTILVYTITTSMNLVGSIDNGPPGKAMRTMIGIINAF